ncbi:MAG: response regulator [Desulfobacteraceae bacterium]|nr:response regulator [Desulfobacteraceae bacterium]
MTISILCIDDSRVSRTFIKKGLKTIFNENNLTIEEASNAFDALDMCQNKTYDFITLDLTMPDMNGYEFLTTLKKKDIKQKIIVLTGDIQPLAKKTVMELGASGYLGKPFENEPMIKLLKKIGII